MYYFARQYDQSIEVFKKSIEMDQHFHLAHLIGLPYEQKKLYREAVDEFQKALQCFGVTLRSWRAWDMCMQYVVERLKRKKY